MRLRCDDGVFNVSTETYTLTFLKDRPFVRMEDPQGKCLAELFVLSGVQPISGRDDITRIGGWWVENEQEPEIVLALRAESACWLAKTYRFRCQARRFSYEIQLEGSGQIDEVDYFGGYTSAYLRWGSGMFWSGQSFSRLFTPEPNAPEANYLSPAESTSIDLMGVPLPGRDNWFFTPAPFCYAAEAAGSWWTIGVEPQPGQNRFTEYRYNGKREAFYLSLHYEGYTRVNGRYTLPAIAFEPAAGEYAALKAHVAALQRQGLVPQVPGRIRPVWWYEPIFCGWGAQCYLAAVENGKAPDYARQALYDGFLSTLDESGIWPGIVVLDDKWQSEYGTNEVDLQKWPDLPGFIGVQREHGRHVLLWLKAWDPEGLPPDECIRNDAGISITADPTSSAYDQRLRVAVRRMLSPEGYDADGFKVDFTARIPSGPGMHLAGDAWGLELMKRYLEIIYTEAKRVKPDAVIITHTPHPYLAGVVDMIRLNDINTDKDVNQAMQLRARVARIACPEAVIDTDNWPITDRAAWRRYLEIQPDLGVPSLYYTHCFDSTREPLDAEDYRLIREVWSKHRAKT